jgi:hypothetical protein
MTNFDQNLKSEYPDWVDSPYKEAYKAIFAQVADFDRNYSTTLSSSALKGIRQYTGRSIATMNASGYMSDIDNNTQLSVSPNMMKVNFNLTAAVIDTLSAKLASIEAVPQAVTNKGNAKGRQLAEDLNFILKGIFHKFDITHLINLAYRDAMINRVGFLKVIKEEGEIRIDRVYADEIIIDPADGYYNKPYKMIHRKSIPRHIMLKKYPEFKNKIEECKIQEVRQYNTRNYTPCIAVAETWCKNSYMPNGRHTISIETCDLVDEDWDKDYFPILKVDYNEPAIGWMGQSVCDDLEPIQREIDRILMTMQAIMKLVSVPRVFVDTNAQVNKNHMTNKVGIMVEYDGKQGVAPIIHNGAAMPPELAQQLQFLIEQGYARVGLTPMDTQGQQKTGSGNQSGEALKTMTDIKSERWQLLQHNYEQSHVELANILLKELQGENIKLSALDRYIGLKEITTKKIPKTDTSYVLKIFPVSSMPDSIPDLIDSVSQMLQLGVVQPSQVPELFKMPDLDAFTSMQAAPRKLIDKKIEEMLDGGKYWNPEPYHDLDYALGTALQHYSWGQLNNESDKNLALLRRFINDVKSLKAQQPVAPATAPQPSANAQPSPGVNSNGNQPTVIQQPVPALPGGTAGPGGS